MRKNHDKFVCDKSVKKKEESQVTCEKKKQQMCIKMQLNLLSSTHDHMMDNFACINN